MEEMIVIQIKVQLERLDDTNPLLEKVEQKITLEKVEQLSLA